MNFKEYQLKCIKTAVYKNVGNNFVYPTLGLASEAGEVAGKIKKLERDKDNVVDDKFRKTISKEIGDNLWYNAMLAFEFGLDLDDIARENIEKLAGRKERGTLQGEGDDR